jgi:KEOPS complex subunit Cgi121
MITERIRPYFLWIQGFRDARVVDSEKALHDLRGSLDGIELQLLRADRIAGIEHLMFAARNAIDSFTSKDRRAKHLSMEFLLFATGEHQIIEAIKLLGVNEFSTELALVGLSEHNVDFQALIDRATKLVRGVPDDSVVEVETGKKREDLMKAYHITDRQSKAARMPSETESGLLKRLVLERSALLVLEN